MKLQQVGKYCIKAIKRLLIKVFWVFNPKNENLIAVKSQGSRCEGIQKTSRCACLQEFHAKKSTNALPVTPLAQEPALPS